MAGRKGAAGGTAGPGVGIERAVALARRVGTLLLAVCGVVAVASALVLVLTAPTVGVGVDATVRAVVTPVAALDTVGAAVHLATVVAAAGGWLLGLALVVEGLAEQ